MKTTFVNSRLGRWACRFYEQPFVFALVLLLFATGVLRAQASSLTGDWTGESICVGGGDGSAAISRTKVGGRITLGAGDELGLAGERVGACISSTTDGEGAWMAAEGAKEGGESAKSSVPLVAWE